MISFARFSSVTCFVIGLWTLAGCDHRDPTFNCVESDLTLELDVVSQASQCNTFDGSIHVTAFGGKEPYRYSLDGINYQSTGIFDAVQSGIYSITVTDGYDCSAFLDNVKVDAVGFTVTADVTPDNICLGGDGTATISVEGGAEPYSYQLENGLIESNNVFEGLDQGKHKITIRDENNCEVMLSITIPPGETGVSWTEDILPIIKTNCAVPGCHNGVTRPDLRLYSKAYFYREYIKDLTRTRQMPFNDETLTQDQIELITCWVDDGALNN